MKTHQLNHYMGFLNNVLQYEDIPLWMRKELLDMNRAFQIELNKRKKVDDKVVNHSNLNEFSKIYRQQTNIIVTKKNKNKKGVGLHDFN